MTLPVRRRHIGLDDELRDWYSEHRDELGSRLCAVGTGGNHSAYAPELRQFAKCGVPSELRVRVWEQILRVDGGSTDAQEAFGDLERQCDGWELLVDKHVEECLRDTLDDANYFVFEEKMRLILNAMTRDTRLAADCVALPHAPLTVLIKEPNQATYALPRPPCATLQQSDLPG